jgi:DNA-binding GntR family transcriptional regulator
MPAKASTNLWVDVARDLQDRIRNGKYAVGAVLPTEPELSLIYGVSRYTVRAALEALQQHGLVSRRKNAGTRVESASRAMRFGASPGSIEELAQYGSEHLREVKSVKPVTAGPALAKLLECAPGTSWIRLGLVRMSTAGKPLSWIDVYVDPAYEGVIEDVLQQPRVLTSALIERKYGVEIQKIEQHISAISCSAALAKKLQTAADSPILQVVRRYIDVSGKVVEVSVTMFPGDRYTHTTYLHRGGGA